MNLHLYLSQIITNAQSIEELNEIFSNRVRVRLGYIDDKVSVEGYKGTVTTDLIAERVLSLSNLETMSSHRLADSLAAKVFIPLRDLVESPANQCTFYQLTALTRIVWTQQQAHEFGYSIALRHAMVLGSLDEKYANF